MKQQYTQRITSTAGQSQSETLSDARIGRPTLARLLSEGRPLVVGILNITPNSFSDGGRFLDRAAAIDHARRMVAEGADILDIGAESTCPYNGSTEIPVAEEMGRLEPVLGPILALGRPISIDTKKAKVAEAALTAGVDIINDVSGLWHDPEMAAVIAQHAAPIIIMYDRGSIDPAIDIIADMFAFFRRTLDLAERAGISRELIVLDPGVGFGKTSKQSLTVIARLDELQMFGLPIMVGASRKRFIDTISPAPADRRLGGSLAANLLAVAKGANMVRVHDVGETVSALRVAAAFQDIRLAHRDL